MFSSNSKAFSFFFRVLSALLEVFTNVGLILRRVSCWLFHEELQKEFITFMRLVNRVWESKLSLHCAHRTAFKSNTTNADFFVRFNLVHPPSDGRVFHAKSITFIHKISIKGFTPKLDISDSRLVSTSQVSVVKPSFFAVDIKFIKSSPHLSDAIIPRSLGFSELMHYWCKDSWSENLSVELKEFINLSCLGTRVQASIGCFLSNVL